MNKKTFYATGLAGAVIAALAALPGGAASPSGATAASCVPGTNIEAIIDDSGSMSLNDRNNLRSTGLGLFIANPDNGKKRLGAVQFGSSPSTIFKPATIDANRSKMTDALKLAILANDGGTNYDPAFTLAQTDNSTANARIFLTDGANNGTYKNSHLLKSANGSVPVTYVVALGIGKGAPGSGTSETDGGRLQRIANETHGRYFPDTTAATVQGVFNTISALVNCQPLPTAIAFKPFARPGQSQAKTVPVGTGAKRVSLVINWANPGNRFAISALSAIGRKGRVLATLTGAGKPQKLSLRRFSSKTFAGITVRKPAGTQRLKVALKAATLTIGETPQAQVNQLKK